MPPCLHHLAPNAHDALVGERTLGELKDVDGIVERMEPDGPASRPVATHPERELAAIAPLRLARLDVRRLDLASADARERVADDEALRLELCVVADVLQLAPAAPVDAIVITDRIHAIGRRLDELANRPTCESPSGVQFDADPVAPRRARNEHDDAIRAPNTVATGRDGIDDDFGRRHRIASNRAARVHASAVGGAAGSLGPLAVDPFARGV